MLAGYYRDLAQRFDDLNLRERALILVAALVVAHLAWSQWIWDPLNREENRLQEQISQTQNSVNIMEMELKGLVLRSSNDPNAVIKADITRMRGQLDQLQSRIEQAAASLISPAQMARLLEDLLTRNEALTLINLQTLKSEPLISRPEQGGTDADAAQGVGANIYKHGFAIEFEGDYLSTLNYLRALEALPWEFFWDGITLQVDGYPRSRVRLLLHTLSLSEGWIGV